MKRFVRGVCIVLAVVLTMTVPVSAAETGNERASSYFMSASAYFDVVSGTKFNIWFDVSALDIMTELGANKIELERSTNLTSWTSVKTYEKADYTQLIDKNTFAHSASVSYTYTTGYYYRATVTLYAKNSSGSAIASVTSSVLDLT